MNKPARHVSFPLRLALAVWFGWTVGIVSATPITPTRDDEVVEVLPAVAGSRSDERRLRKQLAEKPRDAALAISVARRYLDQAHELGDPRFAGLAMSAIAGWQDEASMPDDILMMRATLLQYLHEFDASVASLQNLLARKGTPPRPQAWLTLATVRRVQGRYADSDAACHEVARAGAAIYATACLAENAGLRGEVERARHSFEGLLVGARGDAATQAWLGTSLAELEQRAGNANAAEAAFRAVLQLDPDPYTTLGLADLLIEQKRPSEAIGLLKNQVRTDAVLLRLAIAGTKALSPSAATDVAEMRDRIALANERPDAKVYHGREQAMFALDVEGDARKALALARGNVANQREALDLYLLAQAARASADADALKQVRQLTNEMGLRDQRIEVLL